MVQAEAGRVCVCCSNEVVVFASRLRHAVPVAVVDRARAVVAPGAADVVGTAESADDVAVAATGCAISATCLT